MRSGHKYTRSGEACLSCGEAQLLITICRIVEDNGNVDGKIWPVTDRGMTRVKYLRRLRHVIATPSLLASSAHLTTQANSQGHYADLVDVDDWKEWEETVEFHPGQSLQVLRSSLMRSFSMVTALMARSHQTLLLSVWHCSLPMTQPMLPSHSFTSTTILHPRLQRTETESRRWTPTVSTTLGA